MLHKDLFLFIKNQFPSNELIIEKLEIYKELLLESNKTMNLIGSSTINDFDTRHLLDSLQLYPILKNCFGKLFDKKFIDVGTGAGLPGIPLSIIGLDVSVLDKSNKKIEFLKIAIEKLNLKVNCYTDDTVNFNKKDFDCIISRAFKPLRELLDKTKHFTNQKTVYFLHKGKNYNSEIQDASYFIKNINIHQSITSTESKILEVHI